MALLREQVVLQQKQIEELRQELEEQRQLLERTLQAVQSAAVPRAETRAVSHAAAPAANPAAQESAESPRPHGEIELVKSELEAVAESAAGTNQRLSKLESAFTDNQKSTEARLRGLGNFNFSGDVRLRYEPFFQEGAPDRHRERARARLNLTGKLTDEISGGISLASGSLDDVNSSNQTLTGFFTRKTIGLDRYYITFKPKAFKPLTLAGGKFVYPWVRTGLTFDNDVNPEGFSQTLSFDLKNPVLKNVTLVGFQLPFNEVSGAHDSFILGGQLQTRWKLSDRADLGLYAAGVNFNRADPIAVAIAARELRPSLPNSNTFRTDATGKVIGYESKFAYLDLIAQVDYRLTPRWPMTVVFNFVNNTRAATDERSAYWAEVTFGKLRETRDIQFGYSFIRIEKDAVIGAFNESDMRSATNLRNHRLQFAYQTTRNFTTQWTMWLGKLADPFQNPNLVPAGIRSACATAPFIGCRDSLLNRMQFDMIYKF